MKTVAECTFMASAISRNFSHAHAERRSVETEGDSRFDEAMMMPNETAWWGLKMSFNLNGVNYCKSEFLVFLGKLKIAYQGFPEFCISLFNALC